MILTKNISFKNFPHKKINPVVKTKFESIIQEKNEVLKSLTKEYTYSYSKKKDKVIRKKIF